MYKYYRDTMLGLENAHPLLKRSFENSIFPAVTINFHPKTVAVPHYDYANLGYGWCALTALGRFNPDRGGFLVLVELKKVIRFPPHSTIFLCSAAIQHFNLGISEGEDRFSLVQYAAAGLFRWKENGFCSQEEADVQRSEEEIQGLVEERVKKGLEMLKMSRARVCAQA